MKNSVLSKIVKGRVDDKLDNEAIRERRKPSMIPLVRTNTALGVGLNVAKAIVVITKRA